MPMMIMPVWQQLMTHHDVKQRSAREAFKKSKAGIAFQSRHDQNAKRKSNQGGNANCPQGKQRPSIAVFRELQTPNK
jgi:hypothetical protein